MCTLPGDPITSPCRIGERREIMLNEDCSLSPTSGSTSASNTLLRQLLAGVDPESVRGYSELMNSKFGLRRSSSVSVSSRHRFRRNNPGGVEMRPRGATMYSQSSLSRRSFPSPKHEATGAKRSKHSVDSSAPTVPEEGEDVVPLTIKIEATDPSEDSPSSEQYNKTNPPPWKSKEANSPKQATTDYTTTNSSVAASASDIASIPQLRPPMRPRAHTASEMENVLKACTEKFYHRDELTRILELCVRG
ncbi:unnamed protein product, partial [Dibothriocephalus latus]